MENEYDAEIREKLTVS
jgi:hypothetical protein